MIAIAVNVTKSSLAAAVERSRGDQRSHGAPVQKIGRSQQKANNTIMENNNKDPTYKKYISCNRITKQSSQSLPYPPPKLKSSLAVAAERLKLNNISHHSTRQDNSVKMGNERKTKNFNNKNNRGCRSINHTTVKHGMNDVPLHEQEHQKGRFVNSGYGKNSCSGQGVRSRKGRGYNSNRNYSNRNQNNGHCVDRNYNDLRSDKALLETNMGNEGVILDASCNRAQKKSKGRTKKKAAISQNLIQNTKKGKASKKSSMKRMNKEDDRRGGGFYFSDDWKTFERKTTSFESAEVVGAITSNCNISPIRGRWADESDEDSFS